MAITFQRSKAQDGVDVDSFDFGAAGNDRLGLSFWTEEAEHTETCNHNAGGQGSVAMTETQRVSNTEGSGNTTYAFHLFETDLYDSDVVGTGGFFQSGSQFYWAGHGYLFYGVDPTAPTTYLDDSTLASTTGTVTGVTASVGDLIVLMAGNGSSRTVTSVSDGSNTYTILDDAAEYPNSAGMGSAYCILTSALTNATITVTFSDSCNRITINALKFTPAGGGGGTTTNQSVSGAMTSTGVLLTLVHCNKSGSVAASGVVTRRMSLVKSGLAEVEGTTAKQVATVRSGSSTFVGDLVSQFTATASVFGSVSAAGEMVRTVMSEVRGTAIPGGSVVKRVASTVAGAISALGGASKTVEDTEGGSVTAFGGTSAQYSVLQSVLGFVASSGESSKRVDKSQNGEVEASGSTLKNIFVSTGGAMSSSGLVSKLTDKVLGGNATPAGTVVATAALLVLLAGSLTMSGILGAVKVVVVVGSRVIKGVVLRGIHIIGKTIGGKGL